MSEPVLTKRLDAFVSELQKKTPDLKIAFKDESWLMKLIGKVAFFNPKFMTSFITTLGSTVYVPSREWLAKQPDSSMLQIMAHEYMHMRDNQKWNFLFHLAYLFPITLLPVIAALLFVLPWWACLMLAAVCVAPLPAPGRMHFELRGYTMSMFVIDRMAQESNKPQAWRMQLLNEVADVYDSQFTGLNYYVMWPFGVRDKLKDEIAAIDSGDIVKSDVIYLEVAEALEASKAHVP